MPRTARPTIPRRQIQELPTWTGSAKCSPARNPLVLAGGGGRMQDACDDLAAFAEANHPPVAVAFRRQDLMDNRHPNTPAL